MFLSIFTLLDSVDPCCLLVERVLSAGLVVLRTSLSRVRSISAHLLGFRGGVSHES